MATTKWLGSSADGNWNTAGNWDNGVPANGDSVIVSRLATSSLTTNLDRTGDTAGAGLALALFQIENGFHYNVGSSGTRLKLTATKIKVENAGEFWFNSDMGTATTDTGTLILSNPQAEVDALATESIDYVHLLGGNLTLSNRTNSDGGVVYVVPTFGGEAKLTFSWPSWIGGTQQIHMHGGAVEFANDDEAAVVDVWMHGGEFIFTRGTVSDLYMGGGSFYHDALSPSIISNADILGGYYDSTRTAGTKLISLFTYSELAEIIRNDDWVSPTTEVKLGG